jgi:hypothetical protein
MSIEKKGTVGKQTIYELDSIQLSICKQRLSSTVADAMYYESERTVYVVGPYTDVTRSTY